MTRKNINRAVVTSDDLKRYDYLKLTNAHLQGREPGVLCRHPADPSSGTLFQGSFLRRGGLAELRFHYGNTGSGTDMAGKLYFDSKPVSAFSTLKQLHAGARDSKIGKTAGNLGSGLRHRMLTNYIAPLERIFRAILIP